MTRSLRSGLVALLVGAFLLGGGTAAPASVPDSGVQGPATNGGGGGHCSACPDWE